MFTFLHYLLRSCLLVLVCFQVIACSHRIDIVGEGDVISASGEHDCSYERSQSEKGCKFTTLTGDYQESYTAVPRDGWALESFPCIPNVSDFRGTHVTRDGSVELHIYGDEEQRIPNGCSYHARPDQLPGLRALKEAFPAGRNARDADPLIVDNYTKVVFVRDNQAPFARFLDGEDAEFSWRLNEKIEFDTPDAGDILLAYAVFGEQRDIVSVSEGWTHVGPIYEGERFAAGMWYKVADGSEQDFQFTISQRGWGAIRYERYSANNLELNPLFMQLGAVRDVSQASNTNALSIELGKASLPYFGYSRGVVFGFVAMLEAAEQHENRSISDGFEEQYYYSGDMSVRLVTAVRRYTERDNGEYEVREIAPVFTTESTTGRGIGMMMMLPSISQGSL